MKFSILALLITLFSTSNLERKNIVGKYYSTANAFERRSMMELKADGKFIYQANMGGGCQYEIEGTYSVFQKLIHFKNDKRYTLEFHKREMDSLKIVDSILFAENPSLAKTFNQLGLPHIPDMSLIDWKIGSNYITPIAEIDSGCFKEKSKHVK